MPTIIPVNLADVEAFKDLEDGTYLGEVTKIVHQEAKEAGKYPQLRVHMTVIDGDQLGERATQWVSLSPKAAFRLKQFFMIFGEDDLENLEIDEDTDELIEPDLVGTQVVFQVRPDAKAPGGHRTEIISVEDDTTTAAPKARTKPAAPVADDAEDVTDEDEDDDEAPAEKPARRAAPPARPAVGQRRNLR